MWSVTEEGLNSSQNLCLGMYHLLSGSEEKFGGKFFMLELKKLVRQGAENSTIYGKRKIIGLKLFYYVIPSNKRVFQELEIDKTVIT